jgi:hypothetical protein
MFSPCTKKKSYLLLHLESTKLNEKHPVEIKARKIASGFGLCPWFRRWVWSGLLLRAAKSQWEKENCQNQAKTGVLPWRQERRDTVMCRGIGKSYPLNGSIIHMELLYVLVRSFQVRVIFENSSVFSCPAISGLYCPSVQHLLFSNH